MKYYRFMSIQEYNKVINHWNMTSSTEFGAKYRTDSVGFCFIREDLNVLSSQGYEITIEKMYAQTLSRLTSNRAVPSLTRGILPQFCLRKFTFCSQFVYNLFTLPDLKNVNNL